MSFRTRHSLAGYARAAVDLKTQMHEHTQSPGFGRYIDAFLQSRLGGVEEGRPGVGQRVHDAVAQAAGTVWRVGEPFVLAPAMTAIVAAAAEALDLTGEVLTDQLAPCDWGVLFLPEPVYHRASSGNLSSIAAITWAPVTSTSHRCWLICRWADHHDPDDPHTARIRAAIATPRPFAGHRPVRAHRSGPATHRRTGTGPCRCATGRPGGPGLGNQPGGPVRDRRA